MTDTGMEGVNFERRLMIDRRGRKLGVRIRLGKLFSVKPNLFWNYRTNDVCYRTKIGNFTEIAVLVLNFTEYAARDYQM
jgi:hypothetical protein